MYKPLFELSTHNNMQTFHASHEATQEKNKKLQTKPTQANKPRNTPTNKIQKKTHVAEQFATSRKRRRSRVSPPPHRGISERSCRRVPRGGDVLGRQAGRGGQPHLRGRVEVWPGHGAHPDRKLLPASMPVRKVRHAWPPRL